MYGMTMKKNTFIQILEKEEGEPSRNVRNSLIRLMASSLHMKSSRRSRSVDTICRFYITLIIRPSVSSKILEV